MKHLFPTHSFNFDRIEAYCDRRPFEEAWKCLDYIRKEWRLAIVLERQNARLDPDPRTREARKRIINERDRSFLSKIDREIRYVERCHEKEVPSDGRPYPTHNFVFTRIQADCERRTDSKQQLAYLEYVRKKWGHATQLQREYVQLDPQTGDVRGQIVNECDRSFLRRIDILIQYVEGRLYADEIRAEREPKEDSNDLREKLKEQEATALRKKLSKSYFGLRDLNGHNPSQQDLADDLGFSLTTLKRKLIFHRITWPPQKEWLKF